MRGAGFLARTGKGLASQHTNIHWEGGSAYREVCIQGEGVGIKGEGDCIQGEGVCIWGRRSASRGKGLCIQVGGWGLHPGGAFGRPPQPPDTWDTVNEQVVHILLECILLVHIITARNNSCRKVMFSQVCVCSWGVGIPDPMSRGEWVLTPSLMSTGRWVPTLWTYSLPSPVYPTHQYWHLVMATKVDGTHPTGMFLLPATKGGGACVPHMSSLSCTQTLQCTRSPVIHTPLSCMTPATHAPPVYCEMRSMSGRYASYWNAFLSCNVSTYVGGINFHWADVGREMYQK